MRSMSSAVRRLLLVAAVVILALYVITAAITRPVNGDTQTYKADFTDAFGLHKNIFGFFNASAGTFAQFLDHLRSNFCHVSSPYRLVAAPSIAALGRWAQALRCIMT